MFLLAEELLMLALDDKEGTVRTSISSSLKFGLAGALLMELVLLEKLSFDSKSIIINNSESTGDSLLDEVLTMISESTKKTPNYLIRKLSGLGLKDILINRLIEKGILRKEEHKILWVFTTNRYPSEDVSFENDVKHRIREITFGGIQPDTRFTVLISLINACNIVGEIFSVEEKKIAKNRIKEISRGEAIGKTVIDIVNSINAAVMAGIIAASVSTSSSSS